MSRVLIADDDDELRGLITDWLQDKNHDVVEVANGADCKERLQNGTFDLLIIDWSMPQMTGVEVCRWFRDTGGTTPVLMMTGKDHIQDKEDGYHSGVDDYLTKPFDLRELSARMTALLKRGTVAPSLVIQVGPLAIDPDKHLITVNGAVVQVSPTEFAVLEFLARHPGQVFNTTALLDRVWKSTSDVSPDTVRVYIRRLKDKLQAAGCPDILQNIHGVGYKLQA